MKCSQLLKFLTFTCVLGWPFRQPVLASEIQEITNDFQIEAQAKFSTRAADLLAQEPSAAIQVTAVKLNRTETELEIILETADGKALQVDASKFITENNALIAEIPNAVLALPDGQAFQADNPASDITKISIEQQSPSNIRITVSGDKTLPKTDVVLKTGAFSYSLKPDLEGAEEEIVVTGQGEDNYFVPDATTATKTDTPLRDIPQSIQVIPRQVIEDQQAIRPEEVFRNVSGVSASGAGEGGGLSVNIRGFDGAPVLLDGFRQFGVVGLQNTQETANLERIEVLKGPSSILYGEIQPGGLINLVSKQPLADPFYGAELQVGSRALVRPRIDFSGPLTADKNLLYRVNALFERSDSFRDFTTDNNRFFVAPILTWKIGEQTDLSLQIDYLNSRQAFDSGLVAIGNQVANIPRDRVIGEPDDYVENKTLNIGYNFEHRFNDSWKIKNAFRYLSKNIIEEFAFPFEIDDQAGIVTRNFGGFDIDVESYSLQTNLIGKFATGSVKHTLLLGIDLNQSTDTTFAGFDLFNPLLLDIYNPVYGTVSRPNFRTVDVFVDRTIQERRLGVYLQDQVELIQNLKLVAGLRYDTVETKVENNPTAFDPVGFAAIQNDSALTPRIGIVYQPIKEVSLYTSYSESFTPSTESNFSGNILPAERGQGWEVGIKAELLNQKLFATLAYFDITKQNVATTDPDNSFFSIATGEQKSRGVELDLIGEILPGWNVIAAYAYTNAKVTQDNAFAIGNQLGGIPKHSGSLWTTYEIQQGNLRGFGVGVGFNVVGNRPGDTDNSFELDSYLLTNAAIFYKRDRYKFALNFKNIFDVTYFPGTPFGRNRIDVGEPFTVIGSFAVEF
ncbi:MAG: TonB-dependent siderophore receptor [Aphanocapsa sp. GSE-SYN-MK-11-07L]|nr:TonB-dependent siderophore receptor [Aphanocapsa sp. GSE-SYN-MK-11-07L]